MTQTRGVPTQGRTHTTAIVTHSVPTTDQDILFEGLEVPFDALETITYPASPGHTLGR